jgi:hypothetical protein
MASVMITALLIKKKIIVLGQAQIELDKELIILVHGVLQRKSVDHYD